MRTAGWTGAVLGLSVGGMTERGYPRGAYLSLAYSASGLADGGEGGRRPCLGMCCRRVRVLACHFCFFLSRSL